MLWGFQQCQDTDILPIRDDSLRPHFSSCGVHMILCFGSRWSIFRKETILRRQKLYHAVSFFGRGVGIVLLQLHPKICLHKMLFKHFIGVT